jgi:hypothetical protein
MPNPIKVTRAGRHMMRTAFIILTFVLLVVPAQIFGQQKYVSRYDFFAGYTFLDSPHVNLFENGLHLQAAVRPKTWYSLGFDYSITSGGLTLTPNLLTTSLQQQLAAELPPGYNLAVPSNSRTQTFAGGPQLAYRHFAKVTLFVRPSIGAIYEVATPSPGDPIAKLIVAQLAPSGKKTDWRAFYGFGGGADYAVTKHVGLRVQADLVYDHLFSDLLQDGRMTVRFSVGPCFNIGKNIVK